MGFVEGALVVEAALVSISPLKIGHLQWQDLTNDRLPGVLSEVLSTRLPLLLEANRVLFVGIQHPFVPSFLRTPKEQQALFALQGEGERRAQVCRRNVAK